MSNPLLILACGKMTNETIGQQWSFIYISQNQHVDTLQTWWHDKSRAIK